MLGQMSPCPSLMGDPRSVAYACGDSRISPKPIGYAADDTGSLKDLFIFKAEDPAFPTNPA